MLYLNNPERRYNDLYTSERCLLKKQYSVPLSAITHIVMSMEQKCLSFSAFTAGDTKDCSTKKKLQRTRSIAILCGRLRKIRLRHVSNRNKGNRVERYRCHVFKRSVSSIYLFPSKERFQRYGFPIVGCDGIDHI